MKIRYFTVVKGKGKGKFEKIAFDKALEAAGLRDFNLVPVSSIIPHGSVYLPSYDFGKLTKGSILFGVFYWESSNIKGEKILSGLGISLFENNWGIVIEHKAKNKSKSEFEKEINEMLDDMIKRRNEKEIKRMIIIEEDVVDDEQYHCVFTGVVFLE